MTILRLVGAAALTVAGVATATSSSPVSVAAAVVLGFILRAVAWGNLGAALRSAVPVLIFCGTLAVMQWVSGNVVSVLALKMLAVFLFSTLAWRVVPWTNLLLALRPRTGLALVILFSLFVRHFVAIFGEESHRVLRTRAFCVSRNYGRGSFRSLVAATAALFNRALLRAERFYAAQWLRGLAE